MMNKEHLAWLENYLKEIYRTPILENFLDLSIVSLAEGKAVFSTQITGNRSNIYGYTHGGTLASISDVAMGAACITLGKRIVTIDLNISFIKGAPTGSILTAFGEVISNGNTIMRATAEIFDEQKQLIVRSQASYFITGDFTKEDHPSAYEI
jgi:uncharacterized protein (TIGR00369 family)